MLRCIFAALILITFTSKVLAQNSMESPIYLTNYTFPKGNTYVGDFKAKRGLEIRSLKVRGESAKAFKVSRDHKLYVKADNIRPDTKQLLINIEAKTSEGIFTTKFLIVNNGFIRNKVIAHRGAWKNTRVPENSLAALKAAIDLGCEGSEFDVHMSSDSVVYINHDQHIKGISIAKSTSHVLSNINLSNGESLPTLNEYLNAGILQNKTKLILEIKPSELGKQSSLALTRKVVDLVENLKVQAWVDYISFDYDVCKEILKIAPYAKVSYLNGDKTPAELKKDSLFGLDYHFSVFQKNQEWIKDAKQKGLTVNVWTVNDRELMKQLLDQNVDFITTNEPELLLSLLKNK